MEDRLQVTHLDYPTFSAHEACVGELGTLLDTQEFPAAAVLPRREVQLFEDPAYGGTIPARWAVLLVTKDQVWTTVV
jgi:hypothetical protein